MKYSLLIIFYFLTVSLFAQEELISYKIDAGQKVSSIHVSSYSKNTYATVGKIESIRGPLISLLIAENTQYKITLNDSILFTIQPMTIDELNIESPNIHLLANLLNPIDSIKANPLVETKAKQEENIEVKPEEKNEEKNEVIIEEKTETIIHEKSEDNPVLKPEEKNEIIDAEKTDVKVEEKTKKKSAKKN